MLAWVSINYTPLKYWFNDTFGIAFGEQSCNIDGMASCHGNLLTNFVFPNSAGISAARKNISFHVHLASI